MYNYVHICVCKFHTYMHDSPEWPKSSGLLPAMPMKIHTIKVWTGPYQISLSLVYVYVLDEGSCKTGYYEDYNTSSIEEKYNSVYFRLNFKVSSQVKPNTIVVHSVAFLSFLWIQQMVHSGLTLTQPAQHVTKLNDKLHGCHIWLIVALTYMLNATIKEPIIHFSFATLIKPSSV